MARPPDDRAPAPSDDATSLVAPEGPDAAAFPQQVPATGRSQSGGFTPGGSRRGGGELARGDRVDRYIVLKAVGEGGMGVVYAAYDPDLDRKVALKLLRTDAKDPEPTHGRELLLREAQAMARVTHPNVCAVYDAGTLGDEVFLAMEFVDGPNLHSWLSEGGHSWRELLRVFLEAGQGLAAAHEVGLVHRDFKPGNVLMARGARPRVTDFGLARLVSPDEETQESFMAMLGEGTPSALASADSGGESVAGTPNYMPPEQYLGIAPDARSDQFSFCAALYWALYRKRPFEPKQVAEAARAMARTPELARPVVARARVGVIQPPPAGSKVPAWVRRAVMRGLSLRSEERFASMRELLEELGQEPRRIRRRRAALVAGVVALAAVGAGVAVRRNAQVCDGAEQQVAQVWNADLKGRLEASFAATGRPFAREAAQSVGGALDGYARDWARQHTEACVATRVRGTQTEELLSLRAVCLERRRKELGALARLFTTADAKLVGRAVDVAHALPSLQECQDIDSLATQVGLPADPARRARVEELGTQMAEVKALARAGRFEDFLKLAPPLEEAVASAGYLPLRAELQATHGWVLHSLGKADESAQRLEQAVNDAEVARADRIKAEALTRLLLVRGIQGQAEPARQWARLADSTISRLGGDVELAAALKGDLGNVALRQGRYAEAQRYFEERLKLQEGLAPHHPRRVSTTYNLGMAALNLGDAARATALLTEALQHREATLGRQHPAVGDCHAMLAWALRDAGDAQRSLPHAEAAVAIRQAVFGEAHPRVADALDAVGMTLIQLGRHDEARATFEKALLLKEQALGPESLELSFSHDGIGQALLAAGRPAEAIAPLRKALSFQDVEPEPLADSGFALARALLDSGGPHAEALAEARQARARYEEVGKKARVAQVDAWLQAHPEPPPEPPVVKASFRRKAKKP